uniref:Tetratricopeptide repeat protein 27 (Trinotate prediction) n=1 Tax=Myxobolus squamalis TaxID=59785 RepID=A0A6B2G236_MYXSQ
MSEHGYYHLRRKNYKDCAFYFEKALEINTIQPATWYNLGCSYLELNEYDKAATAFRTCCHIQPDNFKAWTNLSSVLIKQNNYRSAYHAVQTAISCQYDVPQIWLEFAHICIHLGKSSDVIRCFERLIELNPKNIDDKIVRYLTAISLNSSFDPKTKSFKDRLVVLMQNWSSKASMSYTAWWMFARLINSNNVECIAKVSDKYTSALRVLLYQDKKIERDISLLDDILEIFEEFIKNIVEWTSVYGGQSTAAFSNSTLLTVTNLSDRLNSLLKDLEDQGHILYLQKILIKFESLKLLLKT